MAIDRTDLLPSRLETAKRPFSSDSTVSEPGTCVWVVRPTTWAPKPLVTSTLTCLVPGLAP